MKVIEIVTEDLLACESTPDIVTLIDSWRVATWQFGSLDDVNATSSRVRAFLSRRLELAIAEDDRQLHFAVSCGAERNCALVERRR